MSRTRVQAAMSLLLLAAGLVLAGSQFQGGSSRAEATTQTPVTAMDQVVSPANNSPTVAADPADPSFVALASRLDAPDFSCALHVSGDGGRLWTPVQPVPKLPEGAEKCYAPEIAFDKSGRLLYLFVGLAGAGNEPMGVFLTHTDDRGKSFAQPRRILGPLNYAVRMAVDPGGASFGRIHLVWIRALSEPLLGGFGAPPNPIVAAHSDDRGRNFSRPVQISDRRRERVVAPALALDPGGAVHVSYFDVGRDAVDYHGLAGPVWEGKWSVVATQSQDAGRTFRPGVEVDSSVTPYERVMLILTMPPPALAAGEKAVCTAWTDGRFGDADVLARCSTDGGRRWGRASRLNDDPSGNGKWQYMPRLAVSPGGRMDAIFYDRRGDPRNLFNHVFLSQSADRGASFSPNVKVTTDPSYARIGQQYGNPSAEGKYEFGSRLGLASHDSGALAAWADTRNSKPQSKGQDVFSAIVSIATEEGLAGRSGLFGLALAAVGAAGITSVLLGRRKPMPEGHRMRKTPTKSTMAVCAAAVLFASACSSTSARRPPAPPAPPVVSVQMQEFTFHREAGVPPGRVVFQMINTGTVIHQPLLVRLDKDLPPLAQQLGGAERRPVDPFAGVLPRRPGQAGSFAVDLQAGQRYGLICVATDRQGVSHARRGMHWEFRPGKASPK